MNLAVIPKVWYLDINPHEKWNKTRQFIKKVKKNRAKNKTARKQRKIK